MSFNYFTGTPFTENNVLNILIVLLEIAAVMGFYATPAIIWRYAIAQKPVPEQAAKKFNLIFTAAYFIGIAACLFLFKLSLLPLLGILLWCPLNYKILTGKPGFIVGLFDKFSEIAVYIIVGVITTIVSWGVFYLLSFVLDSEKGFQLTINTILNWAAGVAVAYPLSRMWVFHSKSPEKLKEFLSFTASRVTTLLIEEVVMILCVDVIGLNQYVSKYVIASILVIILNYIFSKFFVFNRKKKGK